MLLIWLFSWTKSSLLFLTNGLMHPFIIIIASWGETAVKSPNLRPQGSCCAHLNLLAKRGEWIWINNEPDVFPKCWKRHSPLNKIDLNCALKSKCCVDHHAFRKIMQVFRKTIGYSLKPLCKKNAFMHLVVQIFGPLISANEWALY